MIQEIHKAKPCGRAPGATAGEMIRINFNREQLPYIQQCLTQLQLTVVDDTKADVAGSTIDHRRGLHVVVESDGITHLLRRLYFAQISLYNLEQWYADLLALPREPASNGQPLPPLTSPAIFLPMSEVDLKLLQRMYSGRALGGDGIPSGL
jgi:hypothetical protein